MKKHIQSIITHTTALLVGLATVVLGSFGGGIHDYLTYPIENKKVDTKQSEQIVELKRSCSKFVEKDKYHLLDSIDRERDKLILENQIKMIDEFKTVVVEMATIKAYISYSEGFNIVKGNDSTAYQKSKRIIGYTE